MLDWFVRDQLGPLILVGQAIMLVFNSPMLLLRHDNLRAKKSLGGIVVILTLNPWFHLLYLHITLFIQQHNLINLPLKLLLLKPCLPYKIDNPTLNGHIHLSNKWHVCEREWTPKRHVLQSFTLHPKFHIGKSSLKVKTSHGLTSGYRNGKYSFHRIEAAKCKS